jgi:hypothetical protein
MREQGKGRAWTWAVGEGGSKLGTEDEVQSPTAELVQEEQKQEHEGIL